MRGRERPAPLDGLAELRAANPRLCVVSISPWGSPGPTRRRPATEFTLQAATGLIARRGTPERGPVGAGGRLGEYAAGAFAAVARARGWIARARDRGRPTRRRVDLRGDDRVRPRLPRPERPVRRRTCCRCTSTRRRSSPPPTAGSASRPSPSQQWEDFCLMIGRPEIGKDERFRWAQERSAHLAFFQQVIHAWTRAAQGRRDPRADRAAADSVGAGRQRRDAAEHRSLRASAACSSRTRTASYQPRAADRARRGRRAPIERAPKLGEHTHRVAPARGRAAAAAERAEREATPLAGLRIVDLTAFWAGPFATRRSRCSAPT